MAQAAQLHARALQEGDTASAIEHGEAADRWIAAACPHCARERLPVLLRLAELYVQTGDPRLASLPQRGTRAIAGLSPTRLSDWSLLRDASRLFELSGDFASAIRVERGMLDAKLQILAASHPQVGVSRARIAELERAAARAAAP